MHELSLVQALFDQTDRAIGRHPRAAVRALVVRIGALAGVELHAFRAGFEGLRGERGYADAALTVVEEPAAWACAACGAAVSEGEALVCGRCGAEARLVRGGALFLDRVELEVRDV